MTAAQATKEIADEHELTERKTKRAARGLHRGARLLDRRCGRACSSSTPTSSRPTSSSRRSRGATARSSPRSRSSSAWRWTPPRRTSSCPGSASTCATRSATGRRARRSWRCSSSRARSASTRATSACRSSCEELEAAGQPIDRELDERRREVKADFEAKRGYWHPFWDDILAPRPRVLGGLHAVLRGPVDARRARAQGQGDDLHRLRRLGDAPLRARPARAHPQRARATAPRARRSWRSSSW